MISCDAYEQNRPIGLIIITSQMSYYNLILAYVHSKGLMTRHTANNVHVFYASFKNTGKNEM